VVVSGSHNTNHVLVSRTRDGKGTGPGGPPSADAQIEATLRLYAQAVVDTAIHVHSQETASKAALSPRVGLGDRKNAMSPGVEAVGPNNASDHIVHRAKRATRAVRNGDLGDR
jgi:hypothetical protein